MVKSSESWDSLIRPTKGWFDINLKEIWRYKDLIFLFVKRDFVSIYKQTILGPFWYLIQALITTITYTIIFGNVAKLPVPGDVPPILFYLAGIVCWSYFQQSLLKTSSTFITNSAIFGKVYFPRLVVPISIIISNLISFGIQFSLFLGFLIYFYFQGIEIHIYSGALLLFPVLIIIMAGLGLGLGIIVSSLTTKYRDLQYLLTFGVQLLMFTTPVIYPLSSVGGKLKTLVMLNPMTGVIETFKYCFLGAGIFDIKLFMYSVLFTLFALIIGIILYSRVEKTFMDTV